jgi:GNAT superfamily N-acetyltransferase
MANDAADEIRFEWIDGPDNERGTRPATREEWEQIDDICAIRGWASLNRVLTRILVAWRGEKIVGFHVMQFWPHLEPLFVVPSERGTGLAEQLADRMVEFVTEAKARGWIVIADSPYAKKMCEDRGMTKIKSPVYIAK